MSDAAERDISRGLRLHRSGCFAEAEAAYLRVLEAEPDHPEALHLLGLVALQSGDLGIAVERMSRSIAVGGERPDVLANLAAAYRAAGALPLVEACWRRALAVDADYAPAIRGLAAVLMDLGRFREAEDHLRRVVESDPGHAADHNALGNVARALGRDRDAAERFRRAVALEPRHTEALNNLGLAQAVLGETEDAVRRFRRVLEISPDRVEALYNLGNVLTGLHRFDEAATAFETAIRIDPDFAGAHVHLAFVRLLTGDFERGWAELEWRWRAKGFPDPLRRFRRPRWDGAPLAGRTILMVAEQGLGDTIQFARYGPLLARRGGRVVLESPPELVRLLRTLPGDVEVVARGDDPPRFDCYAALMSLPGLMGTTLETVPAEVPYLEAEPELALAWRRRLEAIVPAGDAVRVGVCWKGSPDNPRDRERSLGLDRLEPILRLPGIHGFGLQVGSGRHEVATPPPGVAFTDLSDDLAAGPDSFVDTAAAITALDLVITVDTAVAHLAGALGRPVWILLPYAPDWRWALGRDDSPWYPTARLFRQPAPGAVDDAVDAARRALSDVRSSRVTGRAGVDVP